MGDIVIVTPVRPGWADRLREHLRDLDDTRGPLGRLTQKTHFARFVVLPLADGERLFFSSRFDGDWRTYVADLAAQEAARAIWVHCDEVSARSATLFPAYLKDSMVNVPYVLSVWSGPTVAEINRAVRRQVQLARFAERAAGLDPIALAHTFRDEFLGR